MFALLTTTYICDFFCMQINSKQLNELWDQPVVKTGIYAKKVQFGQAIRDSNPMVSGRLAVNCKVGGCYKDVSDGRRDVSMRNAVRVGPRVKESLERLDYSKLQKVIPPPHTHPISIQT